MKKDPSISLIIPVHNSATTLLEVLVRLESQTAELSEVLLVDNNSSDHSFGIIQKYQKNSKFKVRVIRQKVDKGLANSYNEAFKSLDSDLVITLQSDCLIREKNGIEILVSPFRKNQNIVASCSLQTTPWRVWQCYNFWQKCLFSRHVGHDASGRNGRFCAFKVAAIRKIGYFDSIHYRTAGEDGDIFMKLGEIGTIVDARLTVDHLHTKNDQFSLRDYLYKENQLGEAAGACLANNFGRAHLQNYFTVILRPVLLLGLFLPTINLVFIGLILLYSFYLTKNVFIYDWRNFRIIVLPFVNIFLLFSVTYMFLRGLITKKQEL